MTLDKIKARHGSLSPSRLNEMPISAQRLLESDMPRLIQCAEALEDILSHQLVAPTLSEEAGYGAPGSLWALCKRGKETLAALEQQ